MNDNGELWFCVYSDERYENLIAIVTGGDNLAAMYAHDSITLKNDPAALTSQMHTQAFHLANTVGLLTGVDPKKTFYGGDEFGLPTDLTGTKTNSNKSLMLASAFFMLWVEFSESGELPGNFQTMRERLLSNLEKGTKLYNIVNSLYRPGAVIGDGGTADWIRAYGDEGHVEKGYKSVQGLENVITAGGLTDVQLAIAQSLHQDLINALMANGVLR